jgi:hypothetical protein
VRLRHWSARWSPNFRSVLVVAILLAIPGQEGWELGAEVSPDTVTTILLVAAGALLLAGVDEGVYVLIPAVIAAITGGVASAWLFLVRVTA